MVRSHSVPSENKRNEAQTGGPNLFRSQSVSQNHMLEDSNMVNSVLRNAAFQRGTEEFSSPKRMSEVEVCNSTSDHESNVLLLSSPLWSSCSTEYSPQRVHDLTLSPLLLKPSTLTSEGFKFMSHAFSPGSPSTVDVASSDEAPSVAVSAKKSEINKSFMWLYIHIYRRVICTNLGHANLVQAF